MTRFTDLDLIPALQRALTREGYETPTEIQAGAIPALLDGRDVLGCAQTGTGKTAAFLLPILQHLHSTQPPQRDRPIRALILTPTRELAAQIGQSATAYGRFLDLRHTVICGGTSERPQIKALRAGVDILVATPGRLLDLLDRDHLDLDEVEQFVLDEADRMLDMGFIHDVRRVLTKLPRDRQNLLFSATLPPAITKLAKTFLHEPVSVSVTPTATTAERIEQRVLFVERADKRRTLIELLRADDVDAAIVFTRTKHGANRLAKQLDAAGVHAAAIHGNKSQNTRTRTLDAFRSGELRVLVATDLASRGIDVEHVTHVVNYELPNDPASYVHRIGRTGRAGRAGVAIALCDPTERALLADIERLVGQRLGPDGAEPLPPRSSSSPKPRGGRRPRANRPDHPPRRGKRRPAARSNAPQDGRPRRRKRGGDRQATPSFSRRERG